MFHTAIVFLMLATVAAFLVLWYLWIRKRLENAFFLDDEEQVLFPFRYFSWILIGLVVITSLVQIHFLRVSSVVHEKLAALTYSYRNQKVSATEIDELKRMIEALRTDMSPQTKRIAAVSEDQRGNAESRSSAKEPRSSEAPIAQEDALVSLPEADRDSAGTGFGQEAKAFTKEEPTNLTSERAPRPGDNGDKGYSMRLNLWGRVKTDGLRVRNRPAAEGKVTEKLKAGNEVKVTEKRIVDDRMWYRVITPSGRAGWVDFRHMELQAASSPADGGFAPRQ